MIKIILILFLFLTGCSQKYLVINNHKVNIEVADTDSKRAQGLSGRKTLCENCGMLFVFDKPGHYGFWMKDMNFPLDFIFINNDNVVDIKQNISPSTYPEIISSTYDFEKVLEINENFIKSNKIEVGQPIVVK